MYRRPDIRTFTTMIGWLGVGGLMLGLAARAGGDEPVEMKVLLSGLFNVYSPEVERIGGTRCLWTGGWKTPADVGPDRIYRSEETAGQWSEPVENFVKPGYHVNDPSIVRHPRLGALFMYYTALADEHANAHDMIRRNVTGLAVSVNEGQTWDDLGIAIGQDNGLDESGAWSPSAVVVGNEIWVYYHTNFPVFAIYRTRFRQNGLTPIGTEKVVDSVQLDRQPVFLSNVDVQIQSGQYVMVANTTDLKRIVRLQSGDGRNWSPSAELVVDGGANYVLTPQLQVPAGRTRAYRLLFGFDVGGVSGSDSVHAWTFVR